MGKLADLQHNKIVKYLKHKAYDIIEDARRTKDTENISGTQYDSFGALLFYNGGVIYTYIADPNRSFQSMHENSKARIFSFDDAENTEKHRGWKKAGIPDGTGTEWAKMLREEIKSGAWGNIPPKGYCLIVFNAAFYSSVQEQGGGNLKRKYRILSQITTEMQDIQAQFKGSTLRGHNITIG